MLRNSRLFVITASFAALIGQASAALAFEGGGGGNGPGFRYQIDITDIDTERKPLPESKDKKKTGFSFFNRFSKSENRQIDDFRTDFTLSPRIEFGR